MRSITLAKTGLNKVRSHQRELKQVDVEDSLKSIPPGEWCLLQHSTSPDAWIAFVNSMVEEKYVSIHIVEKLPLSEVKNFSAERFIEKVLEASFTKRKHFKGYLEGSRIFYGVADGLSGLIIDQFLDKAIIQINTAGIDRYRELVRTITEKLIVGKAYFLDNSKYREKEFLPIFENEKIPDLEILENELRYKLRSEVLQKVGFYYDHRENRNQLVQHIRNMNRSFEKGADLFCYAGAWGMNALKAGVKNFSFVDQGDFQEEVQKALELNDYQDRGTFYRMDVFPFLDEAIARKETFDVILCDPPAFAKSLSQKNQALDGYSKLHRKVLKTAAPGALMAFSSCTHYVNHDEFQKNILDAANKENKKIQLIYCGMQGWDHPITSLMDRSNYIKSYFYLLES